MGEREILEAALFAAGRPLDLTVLARTTGLREPVAERALGELAADYERRGSALEVALVAGKWTMQLRAEFGEKAKAFAQPELTRDLVKTAALIAYHQPLLQSRLTDMIGSKAYEHVQELVDRNLVLSKPSGRSVELTTSGHFPEFFGLRAKSPVEIKRYLASRAGLAKAGREDNRVRPGGN